jgi:hypothetical protein
VIRPYRKNLLGDGEEDVRFDIFSEENQTFLESCYAFVSAGLAAELHRQHGYRVRFNDNPQYPQILEIVEASETQLAVPQDRRRLLSEARVAPRLMSGTMTNSRIATPERSTRYSSTSRIVLGGLKVHC